MRLSLSFAGLLALVTAAACASNEPSPPSGSIAPDTAATPTATTPADTAATPTATAPPATPPTATATATAPATAPGAKTCQYNGKTHAVGASFPSTDGCNTCNCHETGVACTEKACQPAQAACSPDKEPNREYKMRNLETCKTALFRCPAGKKTFFNACGCGCE